MKPLPKQPIIHFHHKIHGFLTVSGEFPVFFGGYAWHVSTPWTATTAALQGPSTRWTRWFSGSAVPPAELSLRPRVWRGWAWRVGRGLGIYWEWANEQHYPSNFCYIQKNGIIMYIYILFIIMSCLWLFFSVVVNVDWQIGDSWSTFRWWGEAPKTIPTVLLQTMREIWICTWWLIPLSKWVTPVISGLTLLIPFITGVITHLRAVGSSPPSRKQFNHHANGYLKWPELRGFDM